MLYLDLDRFKEVNDRMGHGAGDELLAAVAGRVRALVRASDTVARLGGDEFAVVVVGGDDVAADARAAAARIVAAVGEPFSLALGTVAVGASVGAALHEGGCDRDLLV